MKKSILMILTVAVLLVGCGNNTLTTTDESISVSGKVSTANTVEVAKADKASTEFIAVERYLEENASAFACYDIKIADADGNTVQPDGAVEVKIKLTDALIEAHGNYAVFYVNGDNFIKLDCSEADGYVIFKTDHFSMYAVVKYEADKSDIAKLANGIEMEIPHIHKYEIDEATALVPTCTEMGKEADESCSCGDKIIGPEIASLGHNYEEVADSAVSATCDTDGKEADTKCSLCDDVAEGAVIPAIGHSYGEYVYNNDATTSADGTETATCSVCGGTDTRTKAGTKRSYDGYDEFGNGYIIGADGYKYFDAVCPYPIFEPIWLSDKEVIYYGPSRWPQLINTLAEEMKQKNGIYGVTVAAGATELGYYNGEFVLRERIYVK